MHCAQCGTAAGAEARFCEECGAPLVRACLACGAEVGPKAKFCHGCGATLPEPHERALPSSSAAPQPGAERRQLTVLFCDLVGSTALAERLDPEELRDLMQAYQHACRDVIARYDGHVAQYLGDGLMVYFGWPAAHEDDAVRAIRAGLDITSAVSRLAVSTPLRARVGIHTGLVVVGETGDGDASVPTAAVGDTPNIAARLQALAEPDCVVVSERTRSLARGLFDFTDLGAHQLKGIANPVRVFGASAVRMVESRFDASRSELALTPLVGREEEIALLLRRWHQAKEGEGQVVLVGGEPGIGKSRLTRVLRERLGQGQHMLLRYQCSPFHIHSALYPAIEQFERAAGFAREDTAEQRLDKMEAVLAGSEQQVAESSPLFAALLSLPTERYPPLKLSPQRQKEQTLEALARQVEALARQQPLLLIYEDAHWMDATSQEALDLLVPRLRELAVLMIVTYRPEYQPRWSDQAHVITLGLNRLGRRQGAEMITKLTGGKALPQEVLDRITTHTDGVPLFVEELTRSVLESGLLRDAGDQYTLRSALPALAIPATLRDSLLARLDRLAPVKEIAQIGACIGREFSFELLAGVAALSADQLEQALGKLLDSGLVYRRGAPPQATYTFKHALVQDAAYDSLLKSKRAQLHAQIAKMLETRFSERVANEPELLAHHYTQSGNLTAAIPLWRKAGELALSRVALEETVAHLQKAIALLAQLPPSAERDELELSIREPLTAAWTGLRGWAAPELGVNAGAIIDLAKRHDKHHSLLVGLWGMWVNAASQGRIAQSLDWAQRMLAEADESGHGDLRVFGHWAAVVSCYYLGQLIEACEHGTRARALYDPQRAERWMQLTGHDIRTGIDAYAVHWVWMLGCPDQAVRLSDAKDVYARQLGHAFNLGFALSFGAAAFDHRREPEPLLERIDEAYRLAHEQSIPFLYQMLIPSNEGVARLRAGQLREAVSILRQHLATGPPEGATRVPYMKACLAEALALQGDLGAALKLLDEGLTQIARPGWQERVHLAEILRLKGWILMQQGRHEEAETELRASIDWARQQQAKSWELRSSNTLARLLADRGRRDAARQLLEPIYQWFTEGFDTKDLIEARQLLETLR